MSDLPDFSSLGRGAQERLLFPEIISALKNIGGQATRRQVVEELKNSSEIVGPEEIEYVKKSAKPPYRAYKPFAYTFNFAVKTLIFAGFLEETSAHEVGLTKKGRATAQATLNPDTDIYLLSNIEWARRSKKRPGSSAKALEVSGSAEDDEINTDPDSVWRESLAVALSRMSPAKFEIFCRGLVSEMGVVIDKRLGVPVSGDGGIDGYGYSTGDDFRTTRVAIQAKRWNGLVSSPEIDKFRGAMDKFRAEYGIFITTSDFTKDAREAARTGSHVVTLINGDRIADLVAKYEFYVKPVTTYELEEFYSESE